MADVTLPFNLTNGSTADADQVMSNLNALRTAVNALDGDNLATALAQLLGVSQTGVVRRGKSIIATVETVTAEAYTLAPTPDRVSGIELPTDGLLLIGYKALWKANSATNASAASIFLGGNQIRRVVDLQAAPIPCEAASPGTLYTDLFTSGGGLFSSPNNSNPPTDRSEVTTGQVLGGPVAVSAGASTAMVPLGGLMVVYAAAGTYDVSVQFKKDPTQTGITVKSRKLWVQAVGF